MASIQRRQLKSSYSLGGWSVGGIFAFDVAQSLVSVGEIVNDLILIDCPVPKGLDHLPRRCYEYCDAVGLLGEVNGVKRAPPDWLLPHFEACVNSLHEHHARPFSPVTVLPRTSIIWACDAIDKSVEPKFERRQDDPEGLKFLVEAGKDFGTSGWEALLLEESCGLFAVEGANHSSMMKAPFSKTLSEYMEVALMG